MEPRILVIGIGNEFGEDDAAGLLAARSLRRRLPRGVRVLEHGGEGVDLIETWKGCTHVFVVDAVRSAGEPGSVHRFERLDHLPEVRAASSHALGLREAVRLGRVLDALPETLVVYGVEGRRFNAGGTVSDVVRNGIEVLAERLESEVIDLLRAG